MTLPPSNHAIWPLLRILIRGIVVGICLSVFYNSVDARDLLTIITVVLADGAVTGVAQAARPKE